MSPPPGRLVRAVRRAMWAHPGAALTSRELSWWAWPRGLPKDLDKRNNRYRALRRAAERVGLVRAGRIWPSKSAHSTPGGILWRLRNTEET
jgi:hypothetical protein